MILSNGISSGPGGSIPRVVAWQGEQVAWRRVAVAWQWGVKRVRRESDPAYCSALLVSSQVI